jgi:hypothetical protein
MAQGPHGPSAPGEDRRRSKPPATSQVLKKPAASLKGRNFLEQYAIFMGRAQIVEMALKRILMKRYKYGEKRLNTMTLGAAIYELKSRGFDPRFTSILDELNKYRVSMVHEFLATDALITSLVGKNGLSWKPLRHAHFSAELAIQYHD